MRVVHLIADVDGPGAILAPGHARRGVIVADQIAAPGAAVVPLTHLNLDFAKATALFMLGKGEGTKRRNANGWSVWFGN